MYFLNYFKISNLSNFNSYFINKIKINTKNNAKTKY